MRDLRQEEKEEGRYVSLEPENHSGEELKEECYGEKKGGNLRAEKGDSRGMLVLKVHSAPMGKTSGFRQRWERWSEPGSKLQYLFL